MQKKLEDIEYLLIQILFVLKVLLKATKMIIFTNT